MLTDEDAAHVKKGFLLHMSRSGRAWDSKSASRDTSHIIIYETTVLHNVFIYGRQWGMRRNCRLIDDGDFFSHRSLLLIYIFIIETRWRRDVHDTIVS